MFQRYFLEPYKFVPPYKGTRWCHLAKFIMPRYLRRKMAVHKVHVEGVEHLRSSLTQGAGVLIVSNHCRWPDPFPLAKLGLECGKYFYYVMSYHLFKQRRMVGWWLNRIGGYSINREGADREALRTTAELLAAAERPVVIFPEGTWFRQNDRLGPLQEGVSLIVRQAVKGTDRPIHVLPAGLKYWMLRDPRPVLLQRLAKLEARLGWKPQEQLDFLPRIDKFTSAFVALKEVEYVGGTQPGTLADRIRGLGDALVMGLEKQYLSRTHEGWLLERVRRLRQVFVKRLLESADRPDEVAALQGHLDTLLFCENLNNLDPSYLYERPSLERLTEAVERFEETISDTLEEPIAPMGATVLAGPAVDARELLDRGKDSLMPYLSQSIQGLLDRTLEKGPPPEWQCPPPIEPQKQTPAQPRNAST